MKQSTFTTKFVMFVLFLAVAAYIAGSAWQGLNEPFSTMTVYRYTVDDALEATGYLVRSETVIPGEGGIVDVLPSEGEKVGAGQSVAILYRDEAALERKQEIRTLALQLEQLDHALRKGNAAWDNARLDQSIVDSIVELRAASAAGDLTALEDQALSLKSLVLQRESSYGEGSESLGTQIQAVSTQKAALETAAALDTTSVRVSQAGVFSALTDGYETVLTPVLLETITPTQLDALEQDKPQAPAGAIGKLVTSSRWYFTTAVTEEEALRLVEGKQVKVRFSRDWSGDVSMQIERIGLPEDGRVAVVFSTTRFLSDTTLLRRQTVDIIFDSVTGIRIPKLALKTESEEIKDPDTGEVTGQRDILGVYCLTGAQSEFKPVNILADDGEYYLVASPDDTAKKALRAGDEVIVQGTGLFDGKVVL